MRQINTFIGEFYASHDRTPSTTEIARKFGIARSTSQNYLVAMNERGMLSYTGGVLQVEHMDKIRTERTKAPLVGSVPCGELGDVFAVFAVGVADLVGEDFAVAAEGHSALVGVAYFEGLVGSVEVLP